MSEAQTGNSHHVPSPGYFEACRKRYSGQELTPEDHEAIAFECLRTERLFDEVESRRKKAPTRVQINRENRRSNAEARADTMFMSYKFGESVESIAKAYGWTIPAVRAAINMAAKARQTSASPR